LVQIGLERVEQAGPGDRLAEQLLDRAGAGETLNGLAVQGQDAADRRQRLAAAEQPLNRRVAFAGAGHQSRLAGLGRRVCGRGARLVLRRVRQLGTLTVGLFGFHAGPVPSDGLLDVAGQVVPQVPPICHLDSLRSTGLRALGVGAGAVAADHLGAGMISQPLGQRLGLTARQQIDRLAGVHVDQNGAVHISLA
jgi:hypothetical protein